jgi:hypothetical protein
MNEGSGRIDAMNAFNVKAKLIEMFPEFRAQWDSPENLHREDDGTVTLCGVFAEFSYFVGERFASLQASALDHLGAFIEQCMDLPGSELDTAVATCFLENVAGESFTSAFSEHLGSRARQFLSHYGHRA